MNVCYRLDPWAAVKEQGLSPPPPEFIFSCTGQPVIVQSHNYSVQSGETCIIQGSLTYPRGSENKTRSLGSEGTKKQGELVPLARQRGRELRAGQLQGGKGVKQALRTEDRLSTVCKVEIKWSHRKSWMGLHGQTSPRTLRSLWKVWIREEHNHIYSFKIQSRGAFLSPFPPPFHERLFCSLYQGHCPPELQLAAFPIWSNWRPIYLFSATERWKELHTVLICRGYISFNLF